ncbi:MAG: glycosyl hydrolase [Candidatus Koribacter versatilis]|uniref:Glycosyl hydrolase n=1 Tax=Candidatus Korobacter versatilis TaxID=658062 RepID=A0A932A7I8_9BACT|nr:glycosyl hydrolase [Candidatus Koribacter versatilis]
MLKRARDLRVPVLSVLFVVALAVSGFAQAAPAKPAAKKAAAKPAAAAGTKAASAAASAPIDADTFSGYEARAIGPAQTGGRVADLEAVHEGQKLTIYVGSAAGGVFRSKDGGITFAPIFDKQPVLSIGAIKIDPNDAKTIWVGTGESWTRNSVSVGGGLYRSKDGGDTWQFMGLKDSERIARIAINPKDSNTVYVCATGHLWNANEERGLYKTTDGGATWTKVLSVDADTGCSDVSMDPTNPDVLYAGMWQFRRKPYSFESGGPKSAFFKSTDGGKTWNKLTAGLPAGGEKDPIGRIAVAVAPSQPNRVYALVEAKHTALYRSDDAGATWKEMNNSFNLTGRPFYFARLVVDPKNPDRIYKPGFNFTVSDDGGKTFSGTGLGDGGGAHGDYHAVWIDAMNNESLLVGTDGGVYSSPDRGAHFRFLSNIPIAQLYHVSYDMDRPYHLYGGLQDNGTWMGPSNGPDGVYNRDWRNIGFGDGFWAMVEPKDPDVVYVEYQGGHASRVRKSTGEMKDIRPLPRPNEPELRFNWNTGMHIGAKSGNLYLGGQFLFRSTNRGDTWDRLSPDLTTNTPEWLKQEQSGGVTVDNSDAEKYETIFSIYESPLNAMVIWVGTDDGNVQLTRDGGKSWTNLTKNIAGLPPNTWVSSIIASRFTPGTAYATFDGHMTGDMKTYVYMTKDFGQTWTSLATPGGGITGFAHVVREDTVKANLLFVGTEMGLFLSLDGGKTWAQFTGNLPNVPVRDVQVHPRDGDLLIATHGRGFYIVDDLTPIRNMTAEVLGADAAFLPVRDSILYIPINEQRFDGDQEWQGVPLGESAKLAYYQKKRHVFGDLKVDVTDAKGNFVTTVTGSKRKGLVRLEVPTRMKSPKVPAGASIIQNQYAFFGPRIAPGTYTVKMTKGKENYTTQLKLVPDPRSTYTPADRAAQHELVMKLYNRLTDLTYLVESVVATRDAARDRAAKLPAGGAENDALRAQLDTLAKDMETLRSVLVAVKEGGGITGEERIREKMGILYGAVNQYDGRPTQDQADNFTTMSGRLDKAAADFKAATGKALPAVNPGLEGKKLAPITVMTRDDWNKKQK